MFGYETFCRGPRGLAEVSLQTFHSLIYANQVFGGNIRALSVMLRLWVTFIEALKIKYKAVLLMNCFSRTFYPRVGAIIYEKSSGRACNFAGRRPLKKSASNRRMQPSRLQNRNCLGCGQNCPAVSKRDVSASLQKRSAGLQNRSASLRMRFAGMREAPAGLRAVSASLWSDVAGMFVQRTSLRKPSAGLAVDPAGMREGFAGLLARRTGMLRHRASRFVDGTGLQRVVAGMWGGRTGLPVGAAGLWGRVSGRPQTSRRRLAMTHRHERNINANPTRGFSKGTEDDFSSVDGACCMG